MSFARAWLKDASAWPVLAATGFGVAVAAYASTRTLTRHPDITLSPEARLNLLRDDHGTDKAGKYYNHSLRALKERQHIIMPQIRQALDKQDS
jgi:NADH-ubiquinone reductase complex 1 MLRQ subunit